MNDDLLITGFTAFGSFATNPAEAIARGVAAELGARFEPLEVSYAAAEALVERLQHAPPGRWLMFGVAGGSDSIRLERVAHNIYSGLPDVLSAVRGSGPISLSHRPVLTGTLLTELNILPAHCRHSDDAGDYLCNFLYWQALTNLPETRSAFIHVAPTDRLPEELQVSLLLDLLHP